MTRFGRTTRSAHDAYRTHHDSAPATKPGRLFVAKRYAAGTSAKGICRPGNPAVAPARYVSVQCSTRSGTYQCSVLRDQVLVSAVFYAIRHLKLCLLGHGGVEHCASRRVVGPVFEARSVAQTVSRPPRMHLALCWAQSRISSPG